MAVSFNSQTKRILMTGIDSKNERVAVGEWIGNGWKTTWFKENVTLFITRISETEMKISNGDVFKYGLP